MTGRNLVLYVWVFLTSCWTTLAVQGCHDRCEPEAMRCNGDRVEICNTEEDWEVASKGKCDEIEDFGLGLEWTCCVDPSDGLPSCLPKDECDNPEDGFDMDASVGDGGV